MISDIRPLAVSLQPIHCGGGIVARNYYEILTIETTCLFKSQAFSGKPLYLFVGSQKMHLRNLINFFKYDVVNHNFAGLKYHKGVPELARRLVAATNRSRSIETSGTRQDAVRPDQSKLNAFY